MADKVDKPKKKAKPKKDEKGVLAALPSTRPERIGGRRTTPSASRRPAAAAAKTASSSGAAKATGDRRAAKTTTSATSSSTTAVRPEAAARRTLEPTQAATASPRAEAKPATERSHPGPRPVSEGAPGIGTHATRDERSPEPARPSGVELASTAVKAAGEVAQLGLSIGGHVLKRAVDRLPKP